MTQFGQGNIRVGSANQPWKLALFGFNCYVDLLRVGLIV